MIIPALPQQMLRHRLWLFCSNNYYSFCHIKFYLICALVWPNDYTLYKPVTLIPAIATSFCMKLIWCSCILFQGRRNSSGTLVTTLCTTLSLKRTPDPLEQLGCLSSVQPWGESSSRWCAIQTVGVNGSDLIKFRLVEPFYMWLSLHISCCTSDGSGTMHQFSRSLNSILSRSLTGLSYTFWFSTEAPAQKLLHMQATQKLMPAHVTTLWACYLTASSKPLDLGIGERGHLFPSNKCYEVYSWSHSNSLHSLRVCWPIISLSYSSVGIVQGPKHLVCIQLQY